MRAKLTQSFVDQQPYTSGGTRWVFDTELKGFSLAIGKTVKTYYAASEASGRSLRLRVGHADTMSVKEARDRAAAMLVNLRRGIVPKPATTETLAQALNTYIARKHVKSTTEKQYRDAVKLYLAAGSTATSRRSRARTRTSGIDRSPSAPRTLRTKCSACCARSCGTRSSGA